VFLPTDIVDRTSRMKLKEQQHTTIWMNMSTATITYPESCIWRQNTWNPNTNDGHTGKQVCCCWMYRHQYKDMCYVHSKGFLNLHGFTVLSLPVFAVRKVSKSFFTPLSLDHCACWIGHGKTIAQPSSALAIRRSCLRSVWRLDVRIINSSSGLIGCPPRLVMPKNVLIALEP